MELSVLNLLLVLLVAWVAGQLVSRFGYPPVLGELIAGIVLGPPLLGLLHGSDALLVLAEVGILVMMLYIGMEIDPKELGKASVGGVLASLGGFITPFVLCYLAIVWSGGTQLAGVFVGVAAGVTSLATKSRILVDLHLLDTRIAHVMMAGALIADTLSLVIFAAILGVAEAGQLSVTDLAMTLFEALLFFAAAAAVGLKLLPPVANRIEGLGTTATFTFVIIVGLIFAEGAEIAGMHGILGAFLAGLFLREQVFGRSLSKHLMDLVRHASIGLLAPIFFVTAGFSVTLTVIQTDLGLLLAVIGLATVGKIVGSALFYLPTGFGWREGLVIGAGMNGRGAVEIIVAQIGLSMGLITQDIFSILVFMAIATTALVPLFLKWGTDWLRGRGELVRSEAERSGVVIVGAAPTARALGRVLVRSQPVWCVDRNTAHCAQARDDGLSAVEGDALDERVLARAGASRARAFIALTPNREVNALAARLAHDVFLIPDIHIVDEGADGTAQTTLSAHLQSSRIFGGPIDLDAWDYHVEHEKATMRHMSVTSSSTADDFVHEHAVSRESIAIALLRDEQYYPFHSESSLQEGDRIILLRAQESTEALIDRFDRLVAGAEIVDIDRRLDARAFFGIAAKEMASKIGLSSADLAGRFLAKEAASSTVILPGLAVPHVTLDGEGQFAMLLARCKEGVDFPGRESPVHAVFVLAGTPDERNFHLRALAAIASVVQSADFEERWRKAPDAEALRDLVLRAPRRRIMD